MHEKEIINYSTHENSDEIYSDLSPNFPELIKQCIRRETWRQLLFRK